jgi:UDPglucose 6-dehydrogenase
MDPRLAVCGLGKLGACIASVFAASGFKTIGLEIDDKKVRAINGHRSPVQEPDLDNYLKLEEVTENLRATNSVIDTVRNSDICFFVTPTPSNADGSFDHTMLLNAITSVAHVVEDHHRRNYTFVVNSTVMPGFLFGKVMPTLERIVGDLNFHLAYKPELIALGTVIRDLLYPDVLLIGADTDETGERLEHFYRQIVLHDCQARRMSLVEAELAKISLNCAVTMKISFANQVANVARKLGANPLKVLGAVGLDHRVGHAALKPGLPFGGPCFPRDNRMFQHIASKLGVRAPLAEATDLVNKSMLKQVIAELPERGTVGILGLAYKPGTPIMEESAGSWWLQVLKSRGHHQVLAHDPEAAHPNTLEEVLDCDIILVACLWPDYKKITVKKDAHVVDLTGEVEVTYEVREKVKVAS